ncbi:MAG TPA: hypothetical protein VMU88_01855 [bacterium]|nr:hypothetical protein [bacterium]
MNEKIVRVSAERKSAIDTFLIAFPSAFITTIIVMGTSGSTLAKPTIVVFLLSVLILVLRFFQNLKVQSFEYIIADEIYLDVFNKKISIDLGFGKTEISKIINNLFSEKILENSLDATDQDQTKELNSYWLIVLDLYEYLIIEAIEDANTWGWGMVRTGKYSYESMPGAVDGGVSQTDWPDKLKTENVLFLRMGKEIRAEKPKIAQLPFFIPFDSKMDYCRLDDEGFDRKISIWNKFGKLDIFLNKASCGFSSMDTTSGAKTIYYSPRIYFNFVSNPFWGLMKNSIKAFAWSDYMVACLKRKLVGFSTKERNA